MFDTKMHMSIMYLVTFQILYVGGQSYLDLWKENGIKLHSFKSS